MPGPVVFADEREVLQVHVGVADQVTGAFPFRLSIGQLTTIQHVLDTILSIHPPRQISECARLQPHKAELRRLDPSQIDQRHGKVFAFGKLRVHPRRQLQVVFTVLSVQRQPIITRRSPFKMQGPLRLNARHADVRTDNILRHSIQLIHRISEGRHMIAAKQSPRAIQMISANGRFIQGQTANQATFIAHVRSGSTTCVMPSFFRRSFTNSAIVISTSLIIPARV